MSSGAMYTAVTGTAAQQARIDVVANNLANLGTIGFKRMRAQFEDLLYETVRTPGAEGEPPTGVQFGRGSRLVATQQVFTPGSLRQTEQALDFAIDGDGFFAVRKQNGDIAYTRNGTFALDSNGNLVNAQGLLLDPPITIPEDTLQVHVSADGRVSVRQPGSADLSEVGRIQLTRFQNAGGLEAIGDNLVRETPSSGIPITGDPGNEAFGQIKQGMLEESNVNIAEEMVAMILAQRAFEANTRVINSADEMLRFVTQR
jgi:flagellar basal-body rod protein FlgG